MPAALAHHILNPSPNPDKLEMKHWVLGTGVEPRVYHWPSEGLTAHHLEVVLTLTTHQVLE